MPIVLYRQIEIDKSVAKQIKELHKKHPKKTLSLEWYWLKIDDYKNVNWEVKNRLKKLNLETLTWEKITNNKQDKE